MMRKIFWFILIIIILTCSTISEVCATEKTQPEKFLPSIIYTNYNTGNCTFIDSAAFVLSKKQYVARVILKIYWQKGQQQMPYDLYKDNKLFKQGFIDRDETDLFDTAWAKGYIVMDQPLSSGSYQIKLNDQIACMNEESNHQALITVLAKYKPSSASGKKHIGSDKSLKINVYNKSENEINVFKDGENFSNDNLILPGQSLMLEFQLSPGEIVTIHAGRKGQVFFYENFNYHNLFKYSYIEVEYDGSEGFQNRNIYQMEN